MNWHGNPYYTRYNLSLTLSNPAQAKCDDGLYEGKLANRPFALVDHVINFW